MKPCSCPVCSFAEAREKMDAAFDALLDQATERDMAFAYLRDEVRAVSGRRWPFGVKRRLRKALAAIEPPGAVIAIDRELSERDRQQLRSVWESRPSRPA